MGRDIIGNQMVCMFLFKRVFFGHCVLLVPIVPSPTPKMALQRLGWKKRNEKKTRKKKKHKKHESGRRPNWQLSSIFLWAGCTGSFMGARRAKLIAAAPPGQLSNMENWLEHQMTWQGRAARLRFQPTIHPFQWATAWDRLIIGHHAGHRTYFPAPPVNRWDRKEKRPNSRNGPTRSFDVNRSRGSSPSRNTAFTFQAQGRKIWKSRRWRR